ncbi:DUF4347 domain-containing protein [Thermodesulfobacteriota bacterium]
MKEPNPHNLFTLEGLEPRILLSGDPLLGSIDISSPDEQEDFPRNDQETPSAEEIFFNEESQTAEKFPTDSDEYQPSNNLEDIFAGLEENDSLAIDDEDSGEIDENDSLSVFEESKESLSDSSSDSTPSAYEILDTRLSISVYEHFNPGLDPPEAISADSGTTDGLINVAEADSGQAARQIVFVDPAVSDFDQLLDEISAGGADVDVVVLDSDRDGIVQIGEVLASRSDITAMHIISHGSPGSLRLGSTILDSDSLNRYATGIAAWKPALTDSADLLLYGCDVAAGDSGMDFISGLAEMTGADVAASVDATGSAQLSGDTVLEVSVGTIEIEPLFSAADLASYRYLFDDPPQTPPPSPPKPGETILGTENVDIFTDPGTNTGEIAFSVAGTVLAGAANDDIYVFTDTTFRPGILPAEGSNPEKKFNTQIDEGYFGGYNDVLDFTKATFNITAVFTLDGKLEKVVEDSTRDQKDSSGNSIENAVTGTLKTAASKDSEGKPIAAVYNSLEFLEIIKGAYITTGSGGSATTAETTLDFSAYTEGSSTLK